MICPNCNRKMSVQETRHLNSCTYRRYICECGVRLHTEEKITQKACGKLSKIRMKDRMEGH